ncbi:MAG TPA: magnesium/cobalt transporter CorA [Longimicrobiaceae bacterium]|nr:magnesium/cobalt transporter CorA [Longimicrobiaceae bacterium]
MKRPPKHATAVRRERRRRARRPPPGSSPGLLSPVPDTTPPRVTVLAYGPDGMVDEVVNDLQQLRDLRGKWPVIWVNVDGVDHVETVVALGDIFGLHRLALEDVVSVPQLAKVDQYGDYLFIVARMTDSMGDLGTEQIGLFLGRDFVLTFQEHPGDPFGPVRDRIRGNVGRIRSAGPDYLTYAVLDAIVDYYFPLLERLGDHLDDLEMEILRRPDRSTMGHLYRLKRELTSLRRSIWPEREVISSLMRDTPDLIDAETRVYLRDTYDHVVQTIELLEGYRDLASSLTDLYLSSMSQRTNEIMKVLTIFAAIFIPLTFIAGVYGMNFDTRVSPYNMPELDWYLGYPFALGLMAAVGLVMLGYFWRKGWLSADDGVGVTDPENEG